MFRADHRVGHFTLLTPYFENVRILSRGRFLLDIFQIADALKYGHFESLFLLIFDRNKCVWSFNTILWSHLKLAQILGAIALVQKFGADVFLQMLSILTLSN